MIDIDFLNMPDRDIRELQVLFSEEEIDKRTQELADMIDEEFPQDEPLYVISILKGSVLFTCDLIKKMKTPIQLEFIKVSSYGNEFKSTGDIKIIDSKIPNLNDQNVLIVDDICDTGNTGKTLLSIFKDEYHAKKLKFVTLINKRCNRIVDIDPDFYGFEVDDKFLVGYGLDYIGFYRNLPYVGWFPA